MNFNSIEFLAFFPVVLFLHWILPWRLRLFFLLSASLGFYFWQEKWAGFLLLSVIALTFFLARAIQGAKGEHGRRIYLLLALGPVFSLLAAFKYGGFFTGRWGEAGNVFLPAGISFYTFQAAGYVLDVYRGRIAAERGFCPYALFVTFFPQLVAGPIERTEHLLPQLKKRRFFSREDLYFGAFLLLDGYVRKVLVADALAPYVDQVFRNPSEANGPRVVFATVLFAVQIYCDFSGYSHIAMGCARMLGVSLMENFDHPYSAISLRDFWRRWHISLTGWFTTYVYIPLGGNRRGPLRRFLHILAVFLLSGLWHGAGWHFLLWGAIHGVALGLETAAGKIIPTARENKGFALRRLLVFAFVCFGWVFFRAESVGDALLLLRGLPRGWEGFFREAHSLAQFVLPLVLFALLDRLPGWEREMGEGSVMKEKREYDKEKESGERELEGERKSVGKKEEWALTAFFLLFALLVGWLRALGAGQGNAFIYFRF